MVPIKVFTIAAMSLWLTGTLIAKQAPYAGGEGKERAVSNAPVITSADANFHLQGKNDTRYVCKDKYLSHKLL